MPRTGRAIRTLPGDTGFRCVSFSPDGRLVAAGGGIEGERGVGDVKIWEVDTGRERPTTAGHGAWGLALSPDGRRLATGGTDQAVRIWDTASGQEILTLRGHMDYVMGVAFSPDGHRLFSASGDRTVRIWDAGPWREGERAGEELFTLRGHSDGVTALAFHPRERRLVTGSLDGGLEVWDTRTGRYRPHPSTGYPGGPRRAYSPDGTLVAAAGRPGAFVTVLDATTGEELRRLGIG